MRMDFGDLLAGRRMTRTFTTKPVPHDVLERVARTIARAPSGAYAQGQRIVIVTSPETRAQIAELSSFPEHGEAAATWKASAPAIMVLVASEQAYRDRFSYQPGVPEAPWPVPYWYVDAGAALMLILLAAANEGLGAGVFGPPAGSVDELKRLLRIPAELHFVAMVGLGYSAPDSLDAQRTAALRKGRVPRSERIHWDAWTDPCHGP